MKRFLSKKNENVNGTRNTPSWQMPLEILFFLIDSLVLLRQEIKSSFDCYCLILHLYQIYIDMIILHCIKSEHRKYHLSSQRKNIELISCLHSADKDSRGHLEGLRIEK